MYQSQTVIGRTLAAKDAALEDCVWPADALHAIPDWVYTSSAVYEKEIEAIFHGNTWNYVALEAEIPEPGDYRRSYVGPTPVVLSDDRTTLQFHLARGNALTRHLGGAIALAVVQGPEERKSTRLNSRH